MLNRVNTRLAFAVLLIAAGFLFLLQNLGILSNVTGLLWAGLFALGGLAFLSVLAGGRQNWWAAIPGIVLLDLGALIAMDTLFPQLSGRLSGSFFLAGISLAFWVVFIMMPENWWAVIPGGVMLTLAVVSGLDTVTGFDTGGIFFLGLGATFAVLALINVRGQRMSWPWIPAVILIFMGLMLTAFSGNVANIVWPAVLILAGGYLLFRAFYRRTRI